MPSIMQGIKGFVTDRAYEVLATKDVLKADQDGNGKLNVEEFKEVSSFKGDSWLDGHARGFEFAVIDELKSADGQVTIGELAGYYKKLDANDDGKMSLEEFDAVMHKSSMGAKLRFPLAAAGATLGHWGNEVQAWLTKPRD